MSSFLPSLQTFAKGTLATAAGLSTVGVGLLYYGQNYLIYPSAYPSGSREEVPLPSQFGVPFEHLELKTSDGITLRCYSMIQTRVLVDTQAAEVEYSADETDDEFAATRPTIIMFHGNGGNHGHRIPLAKMFYVRMRCNVIMMSYRGYGISDGTPSEKGLCIDAQTGLNYVRSHAHLSKTDIILYGQSIGGAVSIDLASRNSTEIKALIIENTFTSLPAIIPHALPALGPFSFLCHQKWNSISKISRIPSTTPILMLSGSKDELIPPEEMSKLWEAVAARGGKSSKSEEEAKGMERGKFISFAHGTHNDTCVQPGYWVAVADFVASLGGPQPEGKRL